MVKDDIHNEEQEAALKQTADSFNADEAEREAKDREDEVRRKQV
jgi:hypothetical protein